MPYHDGTGPRGTGPNGRRMGPCFNRKPYPPFRPITWDYRGRYGFNRGWGFRGYRYQSNLPIENIEYSPDEEKDFINQELEYLENQKKELAKRLEELNSQKKTT